MVTTPANLPVCLTIGASVSTGGSGVQADLKTFTALSCWGASAVSAVVAQGFAGISDVHPVPEKVLRAQIEATAADLPIAAVKVGLLPTVAAVRVVGRWLREHQALRLVLDPVLCDSRGIPMQPPEVAQAILEELMPRATIATPNRFEAARLAGMEEVLGPEDMAEAARALLKQHGCPVLVTGGIHDGRSIDVLAALDGISHFDAPAQLGGKIHGAGCAHSAAICAGLARGESLRESILGAKLYVSAAIEAAPRLGHGAGYAVIWHGVTVREQSMMEHKTDIFAAIPPT